VSVVQGLRGARVGIDVGGTFTDFVLCDPRRGDLVHYKEPSTPADPSRAVITGLAALLDLAGLKPSEVAVLMHGTTIGLNAIIQRRGADIALIVTTGFRDILEIARSRMPSSFNFHATKEEPLVPRFRVVEIGARLSPRGIVTMMPTDAEIGRVAKDLTALGVDAAALVLINGYTDPEFEAGLAEKISAATGIGVTSAAWIWPEIREYERALVACLNAYIQPLMQAYYNRLGSGVTQLRVDAPILVTASNGGSLSLASASARPVETVLSGPASGVMAASRLAEGAGLSNIITFDMGGTSSDIAVAVEGKPEFATRTDVGGLPLVLPVIAVRAIGAGGGSVVWVDEHGVLKVGPLSAGADPGPVAYDRGGTEPTVTDCYVALGYIDPNAFLGGRMALNAAAARAALEAVGHRIGIDGKDAAARTAAGALAVTTASMATELFKALAQRGLDPADFALVPFGGAGPTHANLLAEEAGIVHIVVPSSAGTFCALGAVGADLRRDFVRTLRLRLDDEAAERLKETFAALEHEGRAWLDAEGDIAESIRVLRAVDMRYRGQAYELRVEIGEPVETATAATFAEAFHREHERIYGFRDRSAPIELGTARLAIVGCMTPISQQRLPVGTGIPIVAGKRQIFHAGAWIEAAVYRRLSLRAGDRFVGPAIIEQDNTTTLALPGWAVEVDKAGNLHLRKGVPA
jgi:N-methylhydantoinase A